MKVNSKFSVFICLSFVFFTAILFSVSLSKTFRVSAQTSEQNSLENREKAYRANNIGVAKLEQFDHKGAIAEFRRALELDPNLKLAQINLAIALFNAQDIEDAQAAANIAAKNSPDAPQPAYILGLITRNQNRIEDSVAAFERVLAIDPNDVGANVNLGQIYIQQRKYEKAVPFFRLALAAEPYNATAMYNLATVLLRTDDREEGRQLMTDFQELRKSGAATTIGQNYLEQGRYAEAVASTGAEGELVDKTAPKVVFQNVNVGLSSSSEKSVSDKDSGEISAQAAALFDFDNNGDLDLVKIEDAQIRLYRNGKNEFKDVTKTAGDLSKLLNLRGFGIVAGDFDNDTFADLLVFGKGQTTLFRNDGKGVFENVTAKAKIPASDITSISGAFLDADHDGDLDIFLGGYADENKKSAPNRLLRNDGDGSFTDISEQAKINVPSRAVAVVPTDYDNRRDVDLLVLNRGGKPNLFRNLRDGSFRDIASEVGLNQSGDWLSAAAGDFNKDTFTDFFFGRSGSVGVFAVSDGRGGFFLKDAPEKTENAASAQFLDYDNDGLLDLIVNTDKGFAVARNLGDGWTKAENWNFKIKIDYDNRIADSRQILSGDIDLDGDIDLLAFGKSGKLEFIKNIGGDANNSEIIRLKGRVSNRTGIGAKIDMRSGSLTQKLETYSASPMPAPSDVHFGLGKRESSDAVRVVWTSGVVQAEIESLGKEKQTAKGFEVINIEELDRKPSSCPYLYTWNGEKFEFITDFLGGGEMGNWKKAGVYHFPDSDEFVRITSEQLKPKNGRYEIRVTNELEEVLFLDNLKLVAVRHDADTEVFPNEGLGIPTAGQRILYQTKNAHAPLSAIDTNGESVLPKIENLDRVFYDNFKSLNIRGYAEPHDLTLNLDSKRGFNGRTLLLLTGWTDYAFSSDNLAASQSGKSQFLPYLQVKNKGGEWQTVIDSIGISVGRPQTLVVDLTGKFLTDSREVRIVTNFKTYWDKIAVDTSGRKSDLKIVELKPSQANLRERGFSVETKYNEMIAPNYEKVVSDGRWKYFDGKFTKTGDVKFLLDKIDDVFVISKTGDELVLSFDALPEPAKNRKYTFLLYADGYSKEMDINSGSPDAVFPLPFKNMTKYPYDADEQFPMTAEKRRIYDEYTTRTVRGFLPPIETALLK